MAQGVCGVECFQIPAEWTTIGLAISVVGVMDIATETVYALSAQQTLAQAEIPGDMTRMGQSLYHLDAMR